MNKLKLYFLRDLLLFGTTARTTLADWLLFGTTARTTFIDWLLFGTTARTTLAFMCLWLTFPDTANSQTSASLRVTVNSNADGAVVADEQLTLREAIEVVNGSLTVEKLSNTEKSLVQTSNSVSRIEFNLPTGATTIQLQQELPPLITPGLVVDGSTQPGYDAQSSATAKIAVPIPVVAITTTANTNILRGLTVAADGVQVRGLSIYGFKPAPFPATLTTPSADIFISHRLPPPNTKEQQPPESAFSFGIKDVPPKNVVIENNWLGMTTDEKMPDPTSAFGVYVFNSTGTTIRRNRISHHDGSAIITSVRAENTVITENILVGNGLAGMPDAVRLEGTVTNSQISGNLICGNDGAGVYLFKPEGSVKITDNRITYNGRRLRRAAVYLMGNDNQVTGNEIRHQTGPGVVVTAFPTSKGYGFGSTVRNVIQNNKFTALEGLSIDLNTQANLDVSDWQRGDGPNPKRNSTNRRIDTANGAINTPEFASSQLYVVNGKTVINGTAEPGTEVEIYRVLGTSNSGLGTEYGPLSEPLIKVTADEQGKFQTSVNGLQAGDRISAIATDSKYGTSEPAYNAVIKSPNGSPAISPQSPPATTPQCTTPPAPPKIEPQPQPQPEPEPVPIPVEPVQLQLPRIVHFALNKDNISPATATVLNNIVTVLREYPLITLEIQGHTDPRASNAYNLDLAKRRALNVRNYLIKQGVVPERMTIRSFGETRPKTGGNTRLDTARDRRVEFQYKNTGELQIILEDQESDLQLEPSTGRN